MGKSGIDGMRSLIPPVVLPNVPQYIPRTLPFVEPEIVEENTEHDEVLNQEEALEEEEVEHSSRDKRQTATDTTSATKQTYCDGVDEIGCYQVWILLQNYEYMFMMKYPV